MRSIGVALIAGAFASGSATAQQPQPSANAIAVMETVIFCSEIMERADDLAGFGLYGPDDRRALDTDLDAIETRFASQLVNLSMQAGYSAERVTERRVVYRKQIGEMATAAVVNQTAFCANGPNIQTDVSTPPKEGVALAMAGRNKTDVLYVDMKSLNRMGPVIGGWQLYVFKADQNVGGAPSKGQWMRFFVDCLTPTMADMGSVGLADLRADKPYTADTRPKSNIKPIQPNTFGAATWMLACGVRDPGALQTSIAAAADHAPSQFLP